MGLHRFIVCQFGQNIFGELFAQLNTPLIEAENVPDHPLDENLMFVHGN
jgi:hypothetical protein